MVWASGSLSFVVHPMCSVTGSKFDPLWVMSLFSIYVPAAAASNASQGSTKRRILRTARKQTCDLYVGVIPGPTPFMLDLTVKIR